jgi:DNA-binding transcriptional ArsR family regulator
MQGDMEVEDVFSSRVRIKALVLLMKIGRLNVSELARKLGVNYVSTFKHLQVLQDEGLVEFANYGRSRIYRMNRQSAKARATEDLLKAWEDPPTKE